MNKNIENVPLRPHDIIFVGSSVVFNLAVSGVYIASKIGSPVLLNIFGGVVVLLLIPFTVSLVGYTAARANRKILVSHILILLYLLTEVLLEYTLKMPFRDIWAIHIPYILVFYAAAFSMIGVSRTISRKAGLLVFSTFIVLIGCLIFNLSANVIT